MERISNLVPTVATAQNQQPEASSEIAVTATEIPLEKQIAMGDVIDRWRLNKGWNPLDNESQDLAIMSWVNVLDSENIPASAYNELFIRALKLRAAMFAQGKQPPEMGIELMLACWESLAKEIEERRIAERRYLPTNAASQCQDCFGSGFANGFRCKHENVRAESANYE